MFFAMLLLLCGALFAEPGLDVNSIDLYRAGVTTSFLDRGGDRFATQLTCQLDTGAVDIVFCMDTSASMEPYVDDLHDGMENFILELETRGHDYRLGGVTFDDGTDVWDFNSSSPGNQMTPDDSVFLAWLDATGESVIPSDLNEVSLDAICDAINDYQWRESALHIVIMFTNEGYHYEGDGSGWSDVTFSETYSLALSTGTVVFIAASSRPWPSTPIPADMLEDFQNLAWDSGGDWYPLTTSWDDILAGVTGLITTFMSVSVDITNNTGSSDIIAAELMPMSSSCLSIMSGNPVASSSPVPDGDSTHFYWKTILDSTCTGVDRCFEIRTWGGGYEDTVYGCITDDSCFGSTDIVVDHTLPEFDRGCVEVGPNPITASFTITNYGNRPATSVSVEFDDMGCDFSRVGGDPSPSHFDEILYGGASVTVNWELTYPSSAWGTTQCYRISVRHLEGPAVHEYYYFDIPDLYSPPELSVSADQPFICAGDSTQLHASVASGSPGPWYFSWFPEAGLTPPDMAHPFAYPPHTTTYRVTATDSGDCSCSDTFTLRVSPPISADPGSDTTVCLGSSIRLGGDPSGSGGYGDLTYSWWPPAGLSATDVPNPTASPTDTITYHLQVSDSLGCSAEDSVILRVEECMPTALGIIHLQGTSEIFLLRVIDTLDAEEAGNGVVMVTLPGGIIGAADLVDTTEAGASPVLINTTYGIRSWRRE
mgnify:CR=1 FL=1